MVFSSIIFLCVFLPIVFIVYYISPNIKVKNVVLIIASLLFYAFGEPVYVFLMLFCTLFNYVFGRLLATDKAKLRKIIVIVAVLSNVSMLVVFKYANLLVECINAITGFGIPLANITLPIGISFFTFQALSYVIDVYRKECEVQKSYFNILLYISLFPQLIAGPIVKYHDIQSQINNRKSDITSISEGIRRFIIGLSKKVLISNTLAYMVDSVYHLDFSQVSWWLTWMVAIAYMLQIYFDFSGYSDMAIGLGKMFGFTFLENFNFPYVSKSIQEFWRRWHISLSTWFKSYLYIPLGGNRKGVLRTSMNKIIVFFTTGLWHGASVTFILWGLWHGLFLIVEQFLPIKKIPAWLLHIYTLVIVCLGFVLFRSESLSQALSVVASMFGGGNGSLNYVVMNYVNPLLIFTLIIGCIGAVPFYKPLQVVIMKKQKVSQFLVYVGYVCVYLLLIINIMNLASGGYNPFIYFRF